MDTRKIALALAGFCVAAGSAIAGPQEDALGVVDRWSKAFAAGDTEAIVALYAPDALFIGTGSKTLVTTAGPVRAYFERAFKGSTGLSATLLDRSVLQLG